MKSQVSVQTGCRVHLGLIPAGDDRFCGMGMMVNQPGFQIQLAGSPELRIESEDFADRIRSAVEIWRNNFGPTDQELPSSLDCLPVALKVTGEVRPHCGLGSGTTGLGACTGTDSFF